MPEIEWQIGDKVGDETIVALPPPRHWRTDLIAVMLGLGAGLGLIYSSIQEPPARPTPTPFIQPSPQPTSGPDRAYENILALGKTIGVEAQALADGDLKTFLALQDPLDAFWLRDQQNNFQAWGRPPANDPHFIRLYFYIETISAVPPRDRATVDIRQYRNGQYFRETRFYRFELDRWVHTRPDMSFWSGLTKTTRTAHFDLAFPIEDEALMGAVADRFEAAYQQVCTGLNCPGNSHSVFTASTIHLIFDPNVDQIWSDAALPMTITLPSPRVSGLYETVDANVRQLDDPIRRVAIDSLILPLTEMLSSGAERWAQNRPGWFYLQAVIAWQRDRLAAQSDITHLLPPSSLSNNIPLVHLESLWSGQATPSNPEQVANSVIFFIEQKFGSDSVSKFLQAIGPANSFAQAIQDSLNIDEVSFEQQWKAWLKQHYAQGS
jgi:hypothetical protein